MQLAQRYSVNSVILRKREPGARILTHRRLKGAELLITIPHR